VPWRGSVSAPSAWGDLSENKMLEEVLEVLSILRRPPMRAYEQPRELLMFAAWLCRVVDVQRAQNCAARCKDARRALCA